MIAYNFKKTNKFYQIFFILIDVSLTQFIALLYLNECLSHRRTAITKWTTKNANVNQRGWVTIPQSSRARLASACC